MQLYIIQSQNGQVLDKHLNWVDSAETSQLFSTAHKDIALNQLIEINARDIHLRARVVACARNDKGNPVIESQPAASADDSNSITRPQDPTCH
ncbi:MAG: hypothetical protein WC997_11250 [Porticoccaceae bacterium]